MTPHDKLEAFILEKGILAGSFHPDTHVFSGSAVRTFFSSLLSEQERGEGWISVKDRLPNPSVDVLVSNGTSVYLGTHWISVDGFWYGYGSSTAYGEITHWQPLPPSPSTKEK